MLGLTEEQLSRITRDYEALPAWCRRAARLPEEPEERLCMQFLYAYMPAADAASYPPALFLKAARDALSARRALPWGRDIPGTLFLNDVLPLRVNNEDLSDCREPFFLELCPRVRGLSLTEAVLEVNYWCLEKATYHSTDIRTNSPLSVVRSGYGRCGEESTLCVAALRSVGIPARQCYTPRWAHCDDNHAWVEVWTGREWHFLGACEPEAALDRGWFAEPASRGMLIHTRVFSPLVPAREVVAQTPVVSQLNILSHYARTKRLRILVTGENGAPEAGARVRFELVNFAQLYPLAELYTGAAGTACLETGFGALSVHVSKNGRFLHRLAESGCTELRFSLAEAVSREEGGCALDFVPPRGEVPVEAALSPAEEQRHAKRLAEANARRAAYEASFLQGEAAKAFAAGFPAFREEIAELVARSNGNHEEIARFLREGDGIPLRWRVRLLASLREKDLADSGRGLLLDHLRGAYPFREDFDEEVFVPYVLCPRVAFEKLTDYRGVIDAAFTGEQKARFCEDPTALHRWIEENIADSGAREYETVSASPAGLLHWRNGSALSRRILLIAACRTLGIPARLRELDQRPEYWRAGRWHALAAGEAAPCGGILTLRGEDGETVWEYEKNFTVARLEDGLYRTLGLPEADGAEGRLRLSLEAGCYRVTTANRLRDGSVLARLFHISLGPGEEKEVPLVLRQPAALTDRAVPLPAIAVRTADGRAAEALSLLPGGQTGVLAFLQEGAEPTEHLLNEILEQRERFAAHSGRLLFLLRDGEALKNLLLCAALNAAHIPAVFRETEPEAVLEALSSRNRKLPLVLGLNARGRCVFHLSGYNVGTGELLLRHLETAAAPKKAPAPGASGEQG